MKKQPWFIPYKCLAPKQNGVVMRLGVTRRKKNDLISQDHIINHGKQLGLERQVRQVRITVLHFLSIIHRLGFYLKVIDACGKDSELSHINFAVCRN